MNGFMNRLTGSWRLNPLAASLCLAQPLFPPVLFLFSSILYLASPILLFISATLIQLPPPLPLHVFPLPHTSLSYCR